MRRWRQRKLKDHAELRPPLVSRQTLCQQVEPLKRTMKDNGRVTGLKENTGLYNRDKIKGN